MTRILRPVRRATARSYAVLYQKARPIVVSIIPGDVLEFRELRRRERWFLAVDTAFRYAVRMKAFADGAARRSEAAVKANATRKRRKSGGA